ncbi:MAG TPA: cytochrome c biogenesis protein CcdA [Candidatus Paceibacterota bacterium]|nr:cytochrome c biogenesis protein CcdA [Candidatus Paceibacterota bacterium]
MFDVSIPVAFLAGLVSFASPCVLPIIPGFLAYIAGSAASSEASRTNSRDVFLASVFFVLGFSVVFALLGILLNTVLADAAYGVQTWLARIGGSIIIVFGLYLAGLLDIPWLSRAHTMKVSAKKHSRNVTSFLFGFAFAAGWTPCVGAILGAIIALAASHPGSAFFLLLSYSMGLGAPFLAVGLFAGKASAFIERYARTFALISKIFGGVLVVLGIFVFTQELSRVADFDFVNNILIK